MKVFTKLKKFLTQTDRFAITESKGITMFNHEIIIDEHDLKLRIQSEIMCMIEELINTNDLGYTSWKVAENIVKRINVDKSYRKPRKWLSAKF